MNTQIRPAPVRKSIFVNAPQARAFDVFTNGIGRWWPKTHKIGQADVDRPIIEPTVGGRWYELDVDGSECEIGKVAVWDPPARLVLIWQLTPEFKYDPDLVTKVEVLLRPKAPAPASSSNIAISNGWATKRMRCGRRSAAPADGPRCCNSLQTKQKFT
jgi:hypothetical protein